MFIVWGIVMETLFHVWAPYIGDGSNNTLHLKLTKVIENFMLFGIRYCSVLDCRLGYTTYTTNIVAINYIVSLIRVIYFTIDQTSGRCMFLLGGLVRADGTP